MTTDSSPEGLSLLSFGDLLVHLRKAASLTQEELATRANLSVRGISDLERGARKAPRTYTVNRLAWALSLTETETKLLQAARMRVGQAQRDVTGDDDNHTDQSARRQVAPLLPIGEFLGALPTAPIVAREVELAQIIASLDAVVGSAGRLNLLLGEPGVGKTRLAQEAMVAAQKRHFLVATGRCYEPQQAVAYYPFVEALSKAYAAAPSAICSEVLHRWPDMVRLLPELSAALPQPSETSGGGQGGRGGQDEQLRLFWQVTSFVHALAVEQPVAILLDDLHWADGASLALLQHLTRHTRADRVYLLVTSREEALRRHKPLATAVHDLTHDDLVARVQVRRLPLPATEELIRRTMGVDETISSEFVDLLYRRTEGNPFFVRELLRALIERGDVYREDGRWTRRAIEEISLPETLREAIGLRLEHLVPVTREVLREASTLGQAFTFADLAGMSARAEEVLDEALDEAAMAGLVHDAAQENYVFGHVLIQETLYGELSPRRRRRLHHAAGQTLERLDERERAQRAAELAYHFLQAREGAHALPYALLAGDQAEGVFGHREAERHYRTALILAREAGDAARETEALEKLGDLLEVTGRHDEARETYKRALASEHLPGREVTRRAVLYWRVGLTYNAQRRLSEAAEAYARAEAVLGDAPAEPDPEWWGMWLDIQLDQMMVYYWLGQVPEMAKRIERIRPVIDRYGTSQQRVELYIRLAGMGFRSDRYALSDETVTYTQLALVEAQKAAVPSVLATCHFHLGFAYLWHGWHGDLDEAEAELLAALSFAERSRSDRILGDRYTLCCTYLTFVSRKRGNVDQARAYAERSLATATEQEMIFYAGIARANFAWVAWREGDNPGAEAHGQAALQLWEQADIANPVEWSARWPMMGVACAQNRLRDAISDARLILGSTQQPLPPAQVDCLNRAVDAWDAGTSEAARAHLEQAMVLARESGHL